MKHFDRPEAYTFDDGTQWLIGLFALFIAFPLLNVPIIGVSLTFPLFIWICFRVKTRMRQPLFVVRTLMDKLLLVFILMALVSLLFAPEADRGGSLLIKDIMGAAYLVYWGGVYLFFRRWYPYINMHKLSFYALTGVLLTTTVILLGERSRGGDGDFFIFGPLDISQNTFAFNTVACIGLASIYLMKKYSRYMVFAFALFMLFPMFESDSRSGIIIMLLQAVCISAISVFEKHRRLKQILVVALGVSLFVILIPGVEMDFKRVGIRVGQWLEPYSPEVALLLQETESMLQRDKSWLVRKTQVDKGIDLFSKYPITGVGWGHFKYVRADINIRQYKYLSRAYDDYALTRSSHNSYIQILAETGVLGFVPFVLIQFYVICQAFKVFLRSESLVDILPLAVALLGVAIYFWTISAITGALWYFILGLFSGALANQRKKNSINKVENDAAGILLPYPR